MNKNISSADISDYVSNHLREVFATMLSLPVEPVAVVEANLFHGEHVSGSVGLAGQQVTGSVYLHISAAFSLQATRAMLGMAPDETPATADINDVVAEVTNMIGGGLKSWLCDAEAMCVLTTPAVIRGTSFDVKPRPGVQRIQIGFNCGGSSGLVEVHIKFQ